MLLLLPVMFVHIGIWRATAVMAATWALQTVGAKLNLECTRLQRENMFFTRNEDFETLVSAPRVSGSWLMNIFAKLYPVKLLVNSAVAIMVCSLVVD